MFIIWLRKDGYVGASAAKSVAAFRARMESPNPRFQLDHVLFTAEEWSTYTVERFKTYREAFPHHLYQVDEWGE